MAHRLGTAGTPGLSGRTGAPGQYRAGNDESRRGDLYKAQERLRLVATAQTTMVVQLGLPERPKEQVVTAKNHACPVRLTYDTNVRREGPGRKRGRKNSGWWRCGYSVPSWNPGCCSRIGRSPMRPVRCTSSACIANAGRWKTDFKFTKTCLGWEEVQLLNLARHSHLSRPGLGRRGLPLRTRRHPRSRQEVQLLRSAWAAGSPPKITSPAKSC